MLIIQKQIFLKVTAGFRYCNLPIASSPPPGWPACNCGLHVEFDNIHLFWDSCGVSWGGFSPIFYFEDFNNPGVINSVDCTSVTVPPGSEFSDTWWQANGLNINGENKVYCAQSAVGTNTFYVN